MKKYLNVMLVAMLAVTLAGGIVLQPVSASAVQGYPSGSIRMVVPFVAGGATDLLARIVAPEMSSRLGGASVFVENMGGGGGAIGVNAMVAARPDGHTLLMTSSGPVIFTPHHSDVGYTNKEFAPVAVIALIPNILNVHVNSGITDLAGFLELARSNKAAGIPTLVAGSSFGISQHITMERFGMMLDEPGLFTVLTYDGGAESRAALMGEQVHAAMSVTSEVVPNIQQGEFIPIAIATRERFPMLPDVPTFREQGWDIISEVWYGAAAPAGTPQEIVVLLSDILEEIMQIPEIIEQCERIGLPVVFIPHDELYRQWMGDFEITAEIIRAIRERDEATP